MPYRDHGKSEDVASSDFFVFLSFLQKLSVYISRFYENKFIFVTVKQMCRVF